MEQEKKKTARHVVLRNPTDTRKSKVFEAILIALSQENWEGATTLMLLDDARGEIDSIRELIKKKAREMSK